MKEVLNSTNELHDVATCLGRWLREQPPTIPTSFFPRCTEMLEAGNSDQEDWEAFLQSLPQPGQDLLRAFVGFLQRVDAERTRMTPDNLSKVFTMTVFQRHDSSPEEQMKHVKSDADFVSLMIRSVAPLSNSDSSDEDDEPARTSPPLVRTRSPAEGMREGVGSELAGVSHETELLREEFRDDIGELRKGARELKASLEILNERKDVQVAGQNQPDSDSAESSPAGSPQPVDFVSFLEGVPMMKSMTHAALEEIAGQMVSEEYEEEDIVTEGEEADSMFVIMHGKAVVSKEDGPDVERLATYGPGDCFGERALLTGETRAATVAAEGSVICLRLGAAPFRELIGQVPAVAALFKGQPFFDNPVRG